MKSLATILTTSLMTLSCQQVEPSKDTLRRGSRLQPRHVFKVPRQPNSMVDRSTTTLPTPYTGVLLPRELAVYQLGRTPSTHRRQMHEAHPVYRLEDSGGWFLNGRMRPRNPGPPETVTIPSEMPISNHEIAAELEHQREITHQLEAMERQLSQWQEEMKVLLDNERIKLSKTLAKDEISAPAPPLIDDKNK